MGAGRAARAAERAPRPAGDVPLNDYTFLFEFELRDGRIGAIRASVDTRDAAAFFTGGGESGA